MGVVVGNWWFNQTETGGCITFNVELSFGSHFRAQDNQITHFHHEPFIDEIPCKHIRRMRDYAAFTATI